MVITMLNKVILMGRLTKDPEIRSTQSGTNVASFSIAVDRSFKKEGQPSADFFNIVAWDKKANFVGKYFKKGQLVAISGNLQNRSWDDADGNKRYVTEVIAEEVHFAESKREQGDAGASVPNNTVPNTSGGFEPVTSDDMLPF